MPHALHYILIHILGLAAKFCVFPVSHYSAVLTEATDRSLTQVRPRVRTRFLPSPCTLNETQKIARLYVPDGVAHGAYTHVVGHFHWTMLDLKAKIKTREFLRHIQVLGQNSSDRIVDGFEKTEKELINKFTADTEELMNHNEWGVGLENLLNSLYEIEFRLDMKAVDLAIGAIAECKLDYKKWKFIEELVK